MAEAEDLWKDLSFYVKKSSPHDILATLPDNAFNLEKGNVPVSKLGYRGFIPFRRHFAETPTAFLWLTFKLTEDDREIIEEQVPLKLDSPKPAGWVNKFPRSGNNNNANNNNNNNNNINNTNTTSPIQSPKSPSKSEQEVYCFKILPTFYEVVSQGITLHDVDNFLVDPSAEIHYIAYNRSKQVDPSVKQLISKLSVGGPEILTLVREWVESGNYINGSDGDEQSLLHVACQNSQEAVVKWLVEHGIELEKIDKNGWTPVLCAINANNLSLVDYLVKKGGMTKPVITTNGSSLLHYIVRLIPTTAETETYLKVLEEASKLYPNCVSPNFSLETPLHRAAFSGNIVALTWLLDPNRPFNFDPNAETSFGDTVLHHAVKSGNPKVVAFLVNHIRIDVPARFPPNSPYNLAVKVKYTEIANLFPIEAKLRLHTFNSYLIQYIVEFLDFAAIINCGLVNKRFRSMAIAVIKRRYKGRNLSKASTWASLERTFEFLRDDLKAVSSPQFMESWNKYPEGAPAPEGDFNYVKIIQVSPRRAGASTILYLGVGLNGSDFAIKNMEYEGQKYRLQFWDKMYRGGRYNDIPTSLFRSARVIMVLYDSSDPTCKDDMRDWLRVFDRYVGASLLLFVGTKADIRHPNRVSVEEMAEHLKELCAEPNIYTDNLGPEHSDELQRYPYVIETRADDVQTIKRALQLAAYMGIRFQKNIVSRVFPPAIKPAKKSIVSSFKSLFK